MPLLEVQHLKKYFPVTKGLIMMKVTGWIKAADDISFSIADGETFGLVGESGCGKTTTARVILLMEEPTGGSVVYDGKDTRHFTREETRRYRSRVQAVFQDPTSSLNPRMRVDDIVSEPFVVNNHASRKDVDQRVKELLALVGLRPEVAALYPHELSGGMRQRVAVARSLSSNPSLIVLDEPVSALDISIRAQLMNLLYDLQEKLGVSYLLIAHDLAVVKHMSTRVGVMYLGKLVEYASTEELYRHHLHPYTRALLSAALPTRPDIERKEEIVLSGEVPSPLNPPPGCRFSPRCPYATPACSEEEPLLEEVAPGHQLACHLVRK